jgi:hypothetical protein
VRETEVEKVKETVGSLRSEHQVGFGKNRSPVSVTVTASASVTLVEPHRLGVDEGMNKFH